jgi:hypothetical protein
MALVKYIGKMNFLKHSLHTKKKKRKKKDLRAFIIYILESQIWTSQEGLLDIVLFSKIV